MRNAIDELVQLIDVVNDNEHRLISVALFHRIDPLDCLLIQCIRTDAINSLGGVGDNSAFMNNICCLLQQTIFWCYWIYLNYSQCVLRSIFSYPGRPCVDRHSTRYRGHVMHRSIPHRPFGVPVASKTIRCPDDAATRSATDRTVLNCSRL